jgi:8-oxo-dGTP pyrophosphatase MutT (NUDIX family)
MAMIREAREEVGIELAEETLEVVQVMHRLTDHERIDFFLQATHWRGEVQNLEPHKCDDLAWYPLDRLPLNTIPYIRRAISNYQQKRWFDTFGWKPGEI